MRAVSTVVDVTVFLLLVSAAVATVAVSSDRPPAVPVADAAEVLGTSTAGVEYSLAGSPELREPRESVEIVDRQTNGTVAGLLARAAVTNATLSGESLVVATEEYRAAVRNRTLAVTGWVSDPLRVDARWAPYPGAPLSGHVGVGPEPPDGVDVRAATFRVPASVERVHADARKAASGGYEAVARVVARATVNALLPPRRARVALQGTTPARTFVRDRYETVSRRLETDVQSAVDRGDTAGANRALARALAHNLETDLRRRFDSPAAAAAELEVGTVRLTVRGWPR